MSLAMRKRKLKGPWVGLSSYVVSKLMGRSTAYVKRLLKPYQFLDLDRLGELIFEERAKKRMRELKKCLKSL